MSDASADQARRLTVDGSYADSHDAGFADDTTHVTGPVQYLGFDVNGDEVERVLGDLFETHIPSRNEVKYRINGRQYTVQVGDWVDADGAAIEVPRVGQGHLSEHRAIVAKVQADMRAEDEAGGKALLRTLDSMHPEARVRFMAHTVALEREQAAALDYAETRLTEMRAQLEALADEFTKPFGPDASKWPAGFAAAYAAAGEAIRAVARG